MKAKRSYYPTLAVKPLLSLRRRKSTRFKSRELLWRVRMMCDMAVTP